GGPERRVLGKDRPLKVFERLAWLQAELVGQESACLLVALECFGLAAGAVEGEHELAAESFPQGMLDDEGFQLSDEVDVTGEGKIGFDPLLEDREPQLLEACDVALGERLVRKVGESRPAPERERRAGTRGGPR